MFRIFDKDVVYKIVDKTTRYGLNAIYFSKGKKDFEEYILENSNLEKFFPKYKKDSIVESVEGTSGLFCFSKFKDALEIFKENTFIRKHCKIIKVKGIEKNKEKKIYFINFITNDLTKLLTKNSGTYMFKKYYNLEHFPNTVFYKKVEVLE